MFNHKLRAVVRHEYTTIIKQPSFWISLVFVPLLIAVIMLINLITDSSKDTDASNQKLDIALVDESGLINGDVAKSFSLQLKDASEQSSLESMVRGGKLDGLIVYPKDLSATGKFKMYSDDTDRDNGAVVDTVGSQVLQQSLLAPIDEKLATLAISGGTGELQTFKNGEPARELNEYIVPGAFLILFYIVLIFSVSYALTSVSEEKENRSIEMVLSYVKPRTLIQGKLIGIIFVTLTQILLIALMAVVAYFIARALGNELRLPFSLDAISVVPFEAFIGVSFLVVGFIFYVALMAMIGAIFPSSKEAGGFSTVFFILPAVPFWGVDAILNKPGEIFSQLLTYFPITSPTTVLFRNAAGNLTVLEGLLSLLVLTIATILTIILTARAFKLGTLEYSERIKFSALLKR